MSTDRPLWQPERSDVEGANLTRFMHHVRAQYGVDAQDYAALWRWSVDERGQFWEAVWTFCGVIGDRGTGPALEQGDHMPGARWFSGAHLNFAENLLRRRDEGIAIVFRGEDQAQSRMSYAQLHAEVSRLSQALRAAGVTPGDRVAAYMPNIPATVVAMLAATSLGAVFSSCSPDFGVQGVLDRFGQIEPKILIAADGCYYATKTIDVIDRVAEIASQLPTVERSWSCRTSIARRTSAMSLARA